VSRRDAVRSGRHYTNAGAQGKADCRLLVFGVWCLVFGRRSGGGAPPLLRFSYQTPNTKRGSITRSVAQFDGDLGLGAIAVDDDLDRLADAPLADGGDDLLAGPDGLAIDGEDDVAALQAGPPGG